MIKNNYKNLFRLKNKNAFVLGGSGLIGKEIVKGLYQLGATVTILDKKNTIKEKNINFLKFDLTSKNFDLKLNKILDKTKKIDIFENDS